MTNDPRMVTVSEVPLHHGPFNRRGAWWACTEPERPIDSHVAYDWRCHGCIRHAEAVVRQGHDPILPYMAADVEADVPRPNREPLSVSVAIAKRLLGLI